MIRQCHALVALLPATLLLAAPPALRAQGLPAFAPLNPVSSSRSGVYFLPYRDPVPGRWKLETSLDYASAVEYNRLPAADYVLDSELLRMAVELRRDLDANTFVSMDAAVGGAYAGFLDGFLDWYHGALGIHMSERAHRPKDQFLYTITLPGERTINRRRSDLFLQDLRVTLGHRHNARFQSAVSLTLPTSTGPVGYGRGVPSVALLNTFRTQLNPGLLFEGSLNGGFTPRHGSLADSERELFVAASSGLKLRLWGHQWAYGNLFYHSPYYYDTTLPALDLRELSLDFGVAVATHKGEWRLGLTEDLEPGGPGIDLVVRLGRTF